MNAYIFSISSISIISAVVCIIAPEKLSKIITFVSGLIIMAVILSPLSSVTEIKIQIPQSSAQDNNSANSSEASKALARSVYEVLCQKYLTNDKIESITVVDDDTEEYNPAKIKIIVSSITESEKATIENELTKLYGINVTINENTT